MKVLFICKKGNIYGSELLKCSGLFNSANFVSNMLEDNEIESKVVVVDDYNHIDKEIHWYKPDHVIIEAIWVLPSKFHELMRRHKKVHWVIRVHSKIPFLAMEGKAIEWIFDYMRIAQEHKNFKVSFNTEQNMEELNEIFPGRFIYLPCIYYPKNYHETKEINYNHTPHHHRPVIDIGCFGAIRPLKNQLLQAVAAISFAKKINKFLFFHINYTRQEQNGEPVFKNIKALFKETHNTELICHPWLSHHRFIEEVKKMDVGMQISFSESFNIVTADFVWNNIPIIVSDEIEWIGQDYKCSTSSISEIEDVLSFAYEGKKSWFHKSNKHKLIEFNEKSIKIWKEYLMS